MNKSFSEHSLSSLSSRDESFKYYRHAEVGFSRMETYFTQNQLTDVTLLAGTIFITPLWFSESFGLMSISCADF